MIFILSTDPVGTKSYNARHIPPRLSQAIPLETLLDGEATLQREYMARRADAHPIFAALHYPTPDSRLPVRRAVLIDRELDRLALARRERHLRERAKHRGDVS